MMWMILFHAKKHTFCPQKLCLPSLFGNAYKGPFLPSFQNIYKVPFIPSFQRCGIERLVHKYVYEKRERECFCYLSFIEGLFLKIKNNN